MSARMKQVRNSIDQEVSDIGGLRRVFAKSTFNSDKFAKNISKNGDKATISMLEKLNIMSSDASNKIKRSVYENYKLFIKAGKAASQLENTMHQIHNEFTEKQRVMNTLTELSLFGDVITDVSASEYDLSDTHNNETTGNLPHSEYTGITATRLAGLVEGASVLVGDSSRRVIFDGDLRELSMDDFTLVCMARVFVLTDTLVIAYHNQSGSSYPYRLQSTYDLNNFAIANISAIDRRPIPPNTFKLLVFPTNRLFQAETASDQKHWLTLLDETMRKHRNSQSYIPSNIRFDPRLSTTNSIGTLDTNVMKLTMLPPKVSAEATLAGHKALSSTLPDCVDLLTPVDQLDLSSKKNPFDDSPDGGKYQSSKVGKHKSRHNWLWDVPEDLDVAISERNFQHKRITTTPTPTTTTPPTTTSGISSLNHRQIQQSDKIIDYRLRTDWEKLSKRIERNEYHLTEALQYELISSAYRHGAPNTVKSIISQLGLLGKSLLAAELFLVYRSQRMNKSLIHSVHQEGNQLIYLNKLSLIFHCNLAETYIEWYNSVVQPLNSILISKMDGISQQQQQKQQQEQFENICSLKFYSWALEETEKFSQQLRVLLIDSHAVSFYSMAYAAQRIKAHADKLTELLGVDISSTLHRSLSRAWKRAADEQSRVLCEAVENRAKQESWETISNLPKGEQEKIISDLIDFSLLNQYSAADYGIKLTMSAYYLIRSIRQFIQSVNLLNCSELSVTLTACFVHMLNSQLDCYERVSPIDIADPARQSVILINLEFLIKSIIPKLSNILNCTENSTIKGLLSNLKGCLHSIKGVDDDAVDVDVEDENTLGDAI
ncbi:unnamed protein product [Heterobilharzia americana]|nr:unnamed protein product [Heterobilharzia americana]